MEEEEAWKVVKPVVVRFTGCKDMCVRSGRGEDEEGGTTGENQEQGEEEDGAHRYRTSMRTKEVVFDSLRGEWRRLVVQCVIVYSAVGY